MTYPLMLYNKQTNKQNSRARLPAKKPQTSRNLRGQLLLLFWPGKKSHWIFFKKLVPRGGQLRALSDQQSVSLVHFHLLLISQEPPSCSVTPVVTSSNSHFGMAAGFPIGRDAVMSRYINELIKQNACDLLFGGAHDSPTHTLLFYTTEKAHTLPQLAMRSHYTCVLCIVTCKTF